MAQMIFVNLPVKDLERSKEFFTRLGYTLDPQFSDENAASVVISDTIVAMLLTEPFFGTFTKKQIVDATQATEVLICLSAETRQEVDELMEKAFAAGAAPAGETQDMGPMYGRSFQDLDGHIWEVMYMDQSALEG
ncbi:MAG: glyoxalase [Streptosporangiales bacterium]|nr:glyoxalase [Streptosporangiales bacterium]